MTPGTLTTVVRRLRKLGTPERPPSDRALLHLFAEGHDEAAFALLVERHGAMVLGVCRRILQHQQDAEDAFQATFLVLARKAKSIRWQHSVASWLYAVAQRVARKIRGKTLRLRTREKPLLPDQPPAADAAARPWGEVLPVLDEEIQRLPGRYREVLVLCCLEGKTRDEAAEELGCGVGSVKGRLERGREMLRARLARRGVALPAALAALTLGSAATAAVPAAVGRAAVHGAVAVAAGRTAAGVVSAQVIALSEGAMQAMVMTQVKIVLAGLVTLAGLCVGLSGVPGPTQAEPVAFAAQEGAKPGDKKPVPDGEKKGDKMPDRPGEKVGKKDGEKPGELFGAIKSVDLAKKELHIVTGGDGNQKDGVLVVLPGAKIETDYGEELQLKDLQPKMRIGFWMAKDATGATKIAVVAPRQVIQLQAVDAAKNTIRVPVGEGQAKDLPLLKGASVTIGRETVKLSDLRLNEKTAVTFNLDKTAVAAVAQGNKGGEKGGEKGVPGGKPDVRGAVKKADPAKQELTIAILRENGDEPRTYPVAKGVKTTGKALAGTPWTALPEGLMVGLILDQAKQEVVGIQVLASLATGSVKAVDAAKQTITIAKENQEQTFVIAKGAGVTVNGQAAKLADVTPGQRVTVVLSVDRSTAVAVTVGAKKEGDKEKE